MPQLLLELFSEEIPARMQAQAADDLKRLMIRALNDRGLPAIGAQPFVTPRRLTLVIADLPAESVGSSEELKGPRTSAPEAALAGFLKKTGLTKDQLSVQADSKGDVYIARIEKAGRPAPELIAEAIAETVRAFPWPKSMTWEPSGLKWVRPLRSILCLFDGAVVPLQLAGLTAGDTTRGHRQMANDPFQVKDFRDYELKLRERRVVLDRDERKCIIDEQAQLAAANAGLAFREDEGLLDEVAGLVECPVVLTGRFDEAFLTVPQEVLISTMRTNQKYFALYQRDEAPTPARHPEEGAPAPVSQDAPAADDFDLAPELDAPVRHPEEGASAPVSKDAPMPNPPASFETRPPAAPQDDEVGGVSNTHAPRLAPAFLIVSNLEARDGGSAIVAGNEKVIRARLADAKFFWEQDLKETLEQRLPKLKDIVFHAKLGTQWDRVQRIERLAGEIAAKIGADVEQAKLAARLCKADLVTGTVGEFPEVQGIIGGYLARAQGLPDAVANAIAAHYRPQGPSDRVPSAPVSVAVALADKLDTLIGFFAVEEKPTGSKDPFALRRAALGVVRIVLEDNLRLDLISIAGQELFSQTGLASGLSVKASETQPDPKRAIHLTVSSSDPNVDPVAKLRSRMKDLATGLALKDFFVERLTVQLRASGIAHDQIAAVLSLATADTENAQEARAAGFEYSLDLVLLVRRVEALQAFLATDDGANLLAGYKRAVNILRIEEKKDKTTFDGAIDIELLATGEEEALYAALDAAHNLIADEIAHEKFDGAMTILAGLRGTVDAFFDKVKVNDDNPAIRRNRLNLLARLKTAAHLVADFSKIEG